MNCFRSPATRCLFALAVLALFARSSPAATIGDPQHPADLQAALSDAYRAGDRDITISPGTYVLPATSKDTIFLDRWREATTAWRSPATA